MPTPPQLPGPDETPADRFADGAPRSAVLAPGCLALAVGAILGGALTGVGSGVATFVAEANRPPAPVTISYGQAWALISFPLIVLWGAAVGAGAALFAAGERWVGAAVQLLAAAAGTLAFLRLRAADVARNGPDVSQTVLYDTPAAVGFAVGALAALLCAGTAVVQGARR